MRRQPYYLSVFNHIARQIYLGNIEVGDQLDSIKTMSERYAAGMNTIRTVIRLLEERGFISSTRGRVSTVISASGSSSQALQWLSERLGQIDGAYFFFRMLFPSMAVFSLKRFSDADFDELCEIARAFERDGGNISLFQRRRSFFVDKLVSKTKNTLMLQICRDVRDAVMLPRIPAELKNRTEPFLAPARTLYIEYAKNICALSRAGRFDLVHQELSELYAKIHERIIGMAVTITKENGYAAAEQEDLFEDFYLYDLLVSQIIDQVFAGRYQVGDYLPSVAAAIEQYQVSLPTVRKAYSLLGELGIAKTANGKGTRITLFSDFPDDFAKSLEGLTRLTRYWEALQLMAVIVEDVASFAARYLSPKDARALWDRLAQLRGNHLNRFYPAFVLLGWLVEYPGNPALKSAYVCLEKDLVLELYLERFFPESLPDIFEWQYLECGRALELLARGEAREFARTVAGIFQTGLEKTRAVFQRLGWPVFWDD